MSPHHRRIELVTRLVRYDDRMERFGKLDERDQRAIAERLLLILTALRAPIDEQGRLTDLAVRYVDMALEAFPAALAEETKT
jgi:hypothetical protein